MTDRKEAKAEQQLRLRDWPQLPLQPLHLQELQLLN